MEDLIWMFNSAEIWGAGLNTAEIIVVAFGVAWILVQLFKLITQTQKVNVHIESTTLIGATLFLAFGHCALMLVLLSG